MHPYATDSTERKLVPFLLAALAIAGAWLIGPALAWSHLRMPWWLQAPSALGLYGALYGAFDRKLWYRAFFRRTGIIKVPDLRGRWHGRITTSFDEHATQHEVDVSIFQTWTRLVVELDGKDSRSHSLVAGLVVEDNPVPILSYQYLNEPGPSAKSTMVIHYGTVLLRLIDATSLQGEYYSGRGRETFGSIVLRRVTEAP